MSGMQSQPSPYHVTVMPIPPPGAPSDRPPDGPHLLVFHDLHSFTGIARLLACNGIPYYSWSGGGVWEKRLTEMSWIRLCLNTPLHHGIGFIADNPTMMEKTEQDQIRAILVQAIANICRRGLTYRKNFSIEGLLGITLDDEEIFLLNIKKETVHHAGYLIANSQCTKASIAGTTPPSAAAVTPKSISSLRGKGKRTLTSTPTVTKDNVSTITVMPSLHRGKRRSSGGVTTPVGSETEPSQKRAAHSSKEELSPVEKPDYDSGGEELSHPAGGTNGGLSNGQIDAEDDHNLVIKPVKKRSLWGQSWRSKPRKSVPVRAVPTTEQSMPVFPEQDATDLGHFLSMKPMLRDIDETESNMSVGGENKDDESNESTTSLHIDTGSNDGDAGGAKVGVPQVYIDHCVDGELSDALNLTGADSEAEPGSAHGPHMIVNGTGDAYQCGICEELFDDQTTCQRHMKHQHKAKVAYTCELCGRRFWHHCDYVEHKAVFHEGPGGYPCEHCGKVLLSKRGLKEHTQHHTGEFPYFCIHCNRGFGRKFEFTGHVRKHHPNDVNILENTLDITQE